tara:strand:- start:95 stop:598 length:504 start_codon:yes stop_codon:yes gene_type:complete
MSQLSANELLRKGDKEGWIKKRRELMQCSREHLEEAWKRHVKKYKVVKPDERTKAEKELVHRATALSKGARYQHSRAFLERGRPKSKSSLRTVSHLSTNALTPKEQKRLALESLDESESESKISSKASKGSGKRKRKTRKRKRRRTKKKRRRNKRKTKKRRKSRRRR